MKQLILFLSLSAPLYIYAQPSGEALTGRMNSFSVSVGGGTAGGGGAVAFASGVGKGIVTARFLFNDELNLFGDFSRQIWDVGGLYGFASGNHSLFVSGSAGLAITGGVKKGIYIEPPAGSWFGGGYERVSFVTIGIPLQVDGKMRLTGSLGLGASLYANLNPVSSAAGFMIGINIGDIWPAWKK